MAPRKTLLRQQIRQVMASGLAPRAPWIALLGTLASAQPLHANDTHAQWNCQPSADGQAWSCNTVQVEGPAYKRPQHARGRSAAVTSAPVATNKPRHLPAAQVDWVAQEQLSKEQVKSMTPGCCGRYIEPPLTHEDAELDPAKAPLRASADRSELLQEITAVLEGDVLLTQGHRKLQADRIELNQETDIATLEGDIRLREPGLLLTGSRAELNVDQGYAHIDNASYLVHEQEIRGDASRLSRRNDETLVLEGGTFTRCEPDSDTWYLRGAELTLDPVNEVGTGRHVRLEVKGVPVLYTPWISFATGDRRTSGFLFPSISSSDSGGIDIATPYYFNLAPDYDLTLTPRFISDRGEMLEVETRHLSRWFETKLSGAYLAKDEGGDDEDLQDLIDEGLISEEEARPYLDEDRWLVAVDHRGGWDQPWYSRVDYTRVSDEDYFRDLDTASLEVNSQTHLRQQGTLGYRSDHWHGQLRAEEYQTLSSTASTPYKQLPRVNVDGLYQFGSLQLSLGHEYTSFDHRDKDSDQIVTGERARLEYGLHWDKQWAWGFFKPGVMVKSLSYELDDEHLAAGANDSPSFTVPQASVDMGLFFEREGALFGDHYVQTFEPRLYYFYSEFENQDELIDATSTGGDINFDSSDLTFTYSQLFRDSRYAGGDRIDDDDRLSVGLTTRFLEPASGREMFSASLGQIIYFDDRAVDLHLRSEDVLANDQLDSSEFAAQVSARIGQNWRLSSDVIWDENNSNKVTRGSASLRYRDDQWRLFNLSYRYVRKDPVIDSGDADGDGNISELLDRNIEQGDMSLSWPIAGNWSMVARANYDFTHNRELETLFGVEYNSCCYRWRLVARQWLDNDLVDVIDSLDLEKDQGIFFEFQLKGLGGIGNKVTGILADSIYGYREREQNIK
jgi:LPS-assembly protein